ncbi:MAG: hypothetical protein QM817_35010 [Archangium sp.]
MQTPKEVSKFQKQKTAEIVKNDDGSVTKRRETARGSKELTTREGKLLEKSTEYRRTSTTAKGSQTDSSFADRNDMLGRRSLEKRTETINPRGDSSVKLQTRDVFGIDKTSTQKSTTRERGDTTTTRNTTSSFDSRGNRANSSDVTRVTTNGGTTVTRNAKDASGSELTTRSSTTYEDGKFTLSDGADWTKNKSIERSYMKETEFDSKPITDKADKITPWIGKIFKALGIEQTWSSQVDPSRMTENTLFQNDIAKVGSRVGITGGQSLTIDHTGIHGQFNREAVAGITAEVGDHVEGKYGSADYHARATAEASASVDAQGKIDANGLDATVTLRAGAKVEVDATGHAQTQSVTLGGVEMHAAADAHVRASAEVSAEATGTVKITRNPPTAVARGTAGASAVAKIEGEITLSAGPFAVTGSAYGSAGAEARATGVIGYEDGKLKIGGSVGAALGLGGGAGVTVEVDVAQIGEAAKGLADVDGDGQLGFGDVVAAGKKAVDVARNVAHAADVNGDGHLGLDDVGAAASNVAHKAADVAHNAAKKVASWFGF